MSYSWFKFKRDISIFIIFELMPFIVVCSFIIGLAAVVFSLYMVFGYLAR